MDTHIVFIIIKITVVVIWETVLQAVVAGNNYLIRETPESEYVLILQPLMPVHLQIASLSSERVNFKSFKINSKKALRHNNQLMIMVKTKK